VLVYVISYMYVYGVVLRHTHTKLVFAMCGGFSLRYITRKRCPFNRRVIYQTREHEHWRLFTSASNQTTDLIRSADDSYIADMVH
jgi:hypothetical protein